MAKAIVQSKSNGAILEWEAHEYEHKVRSPDWFWATGIITLGLALAAMIFGNIILAILIVVGALSLSLFLNRPPGSVRVEINQNGIRRGNVLYPFETLSAFWLELDHPHKKILLRSKKLLMPIIIVPLNGEVDMPKLHEELSKHLTEEYHALPLIEKILEYLGF